MPDNKKTAVTKDLLVEVGCEELPPAAVQGARAQLPGLAGAALAAYRLPAREIAAFATPRRLVLLARGVPTRQRPEVKKIVGPPRARALGADGELTAAALGFLNKWGIGPEGARVEKTAKGEYFVAEVPSPQEVATDVLSDLLPALLSELSFAKTMRWPQSNVPFARPVRWLVCLFGGAVVPSAFAGLTTGATSLGHRTISPGPKDLAAVFTKRGTVNPEALKKFYEKDLGVVIDVADRRAEVIAQLKNVGVPASYLDEADYRIKSTFARVLDEVEAPSLVTDSFDVKYLWLPELVIETALLSYLHLFPLRKENGELRPRFFAISNARKEALPNFQAGIAKVIRARLADAEYFWREDLKTPLDDMARALEGVLFAEGAGTLADKTARLVEVAAALADEMSLSAVEKKHLVRAAALSKADLTSQMVREKEFAHLQGAMGRLYAAQAGEAPAVAAAIGEHYRPVGADDALPETKLGRALSLADRLDTLVTLFAAGYKPTGAKDPFALRRAAIGLCRLLLENGDGFFGRLAIENVVARAAAAGGVSGDAGTDEEVTKFIYARLAHIFLDRGFRDDMVNAVVYPAPEVAAPLTSAADKLRRLEALRDFYERRDEYIPLAIAFKRPINILRQAREKGFGKQERLDEKLLVEEEERRLYRAYREVEPEVRGAIARADYAAALGLLAKLRPAVDAFFDEVMVLCEEEDLRENRLALMQLLAEMFLSFADFTRLRGEEEYE